MMSWPASFDFQPACRLVDEARDGYGRVRYSQGVVPDRGAGMASAERAGTGKSERGGAMPPTRGGGIDQGRDGHADGSTTVLPVTFCEPRGFECAGNRFIARADTPGCVSPRRARQTPSSSSPGCDRRSCRRRPCVPVGRRAERGVRRMPSAGNSKQQSSGAVSGRLHRAIAPRATERLLASLPCNRRKGTRKGQRPPSRLTVRRPEDI